MLLLVAENCDLKNMLQALQDNRKRADSTLDQNIAFRAYRRHQPILLQQEQIKPQTEAVEQQIISDID